MTEGEGEEKRRAQKKGKAVMVSCSHTNTSGVLCLKDKVLVENKCKEQSGKLRRKSQDI